MRVLGDDGIKCFNVNSALHILLATVNINNYTMIITLQSTFEGKFRIIIAVTICHGSHRSYSDHANVSYAELYNSVTLRYVTCN